MNSPIQILEKYWNYTSFRAPQKEIIEAVLNKKNTIALLPTGGGKSICFQIPGLLLEGVCIVISPLIALMQDQINGLQKRGIKATTIESGSSQNEIITLFDNIKFGGFKFLYLSPERLQSKFIQQKIKELNVSLIAIDEAHCISEWGHDFRPSYRNIKILRDLKPATPTIALTATANNKVLEDISKNLDFKSPFLFKKSFFRKNLAYQVFTVEDKLSRLIQIFTKTKSPAIVYVNSRKKTEQIANFLNANNFKSSFYHGGISSEEKKIAFNNWMTEKTPIIIATNAFGMGIDKENVGIVVHFDFPNSIENYIQEAGRAGRNGEKSFAVLLQNADDIRIFKEQTKISLPTIIEVKEIHKKLYQNFRIAKGEFIEDNFEFNLFDFCKKYKFTPNKTATVLTILENHGIIKASSSFNKKSTVKFIVSSKKVLKNNSLKDFTTALLRTYGGLFEEETKINEFVLAKKVGITSKQVIANLKRLQTEGLIEYNQTVLDAEITFLLPREDDITINRNSKEIEQFIRQKKQKAKDILQFIKENKICRSSQILSYFNEKQIEDCKICDVCLSKKQLKLASISSEIINLLKENKTLSSREICIVLHFNEQEILIHLRQLLSEEKIGLNSQNKFYLK